MLITVDRIADTCFRVIKSHRYALIGDARAWHCNGVSNARESPKVRIHGHLPRLREHYFSIALLKRGKEKRIFSSFRFRVTAIRIDSDLEFAIPSGTLSGYIYDLGSLIQIILQSTLDCNRLKIKILKDLYIAALQGCSFF